TASILSRMPGGRAKALILESTPNFDWQGIAAARGLIIIPPNAAMSTSEVVAIAARFEPGSGVICSGDAMKCPMRIQILASYRHVRRLEPAARDGDNSDELAMCDRSLKRAAGSPRAG